jgi:Peptidase A4 family
VVPDVAAPTDNGTYYCATWIGIDGDGSGDVFQAGVESEVKGTSVTIYPWWEWFPTPEVQITNLKVNAGDMVTMLLCSEQGAGSTTGTVFFSNRTTGQSTSVGLTAPAGTSLTGNSAEWIVEAPTVDGSQSALADYGEVFFSVCDAYTAKGVTIDGGSGDSINMTAGSTTVSDGILITPTVVQCEYVGALP